MIETKKKNSFLIVSIIVIILIVLVAIILAQKNNSNSPTGEKKPGSNQNNSATTATNTDASTIIEDVKVAPVTEAQPLEDVKIVVPGANPITKENKVVTKTGEVTDNTAPIMSENAPRQTGFLNKEELPSGLTSLSISAKGFTPNEFTTKAGAPTTFAITSTDSEVHLIAFNDQALGAIAILVGPGQTKAITFNAPATAGNYSFSCATPGHANRGETGTMIVK